MDPKKCVVLNKLELKRILNYQILLIHFIYTVDLLNQKLRHFIVPSKMEDWKVRTRG